jgi:hypothetical protein
MTDKPMKAFKNILDDGRVVLAGREAELACDCWGIVHDVKFTPAAYDLAIGASEPLNAPFNDLVHALADATKTLVGDVAVVLTKGGPVIAYFVRKVRDGSVACVQFSTAGEAVKPEWIAPILPTPQEAEADRLAAKAAEAARVAKAEAERKAGGRARALGEIHSNPDIAILQLQILAGVREDDGSLVVRR